MKTSRQKGWTRCFLALDEVDDATLKQLAGIPGIGVETGPKGAVVAVPDNTMQLRNVRDFLATGGVRGEAVFDQTQMFTRWKSTRELFPHQASAVFCAIAAQRQHGGIIIADEMGLGKALHVDEPVLTPEGWHRIGDLQVGDPVCDPDGGVARVTGVFPQGLRPLMRVTFSDGTWSIADAEHRWLVFTANDRFRGGVGRVKTTAELRAEGLRSPPDRRGWTARRWFLPVNAPVDFGDAEEGLLPVDPYVLGVLIGDGSLRGGVTFSSQDPELVDEVQRRQAPKMVKAHQHGTRCPVYAVHDVTSELRALGLHGCLAIEKFIPVRYLYETPAVRLELLRGLMDTDGTCTPDGTATFCTSSSQLRDDVVFLVRSLGGICTVGLREAPTYMYRGEQRVGQPAYRVNVRLGENPFLLSRKADRWRAPILAKSIESIEDVGQGPTVCISVDSKRNLYMTRDFTVTHNTFEAIVAAQTFALTSQKKWKLVVGLKYLRDTWRDELVATGAIAKPEDLVVFEGTHGGIRQLPPGAEWFFIHYDILHWWKGWLYQAPFGVVIADEAHLARGTKTLRGKALDALGTIPFRIALTGTPLVNRVGEMWRLLTFVCGARSWGSHFDFRLQYAGAYHDGHGYKDGEPSNTNELEQRLTSCYLRRTFADTNVKLPSFTRRAVVVDYLDRAAYDEAARELTASKEMSLLLHGGGGTDTLGLLGRLRALTSRAKIGATVEQVSSFLDQEEPVVVFTHERATARAIVAKLAHKGYDAFEITGEDSADDRGTKIRSFQQATAPVALVATLDSLGVGVTLHRARVVIIHDLPWTFAALVQGEKRIHRIGQTRPCTSLWMLAEKSVDTLIGKILLEKAKRLAEVLGDEEAVLAADEVELAKIVGVDDGAFQRHMDEWLTEATTT